MAFYIAIVACLIAIADAEAKPEWIQKVPGLNEYQDMLLNKAKFLAESKGRGLGAQIVGWLWVGCFM